MPSIAKAIYDNDAETGDELSFERDDILTVLEKDYDGYEGWWLCSFRDKMGIAPANRLQIIYEIKVTPVAGPAVRATAGTGPRFLSQMTHLDYDTPKPNVPRKIGGSCEDLLSISKDEEYYTGRGGGQESYPGGKVSSDRLEVGQRIAARKRGTSCDNVLKLAWSSPDSPVINSGRGDANTEYDVPVSLSPDDYDAPGKHSERNVPEGQKKFSQGHGKNACQENRKNSDNGRTEIHGKTVNQDYDIPVQHSLNEYKLPGNISHRNLSNGQAKPVQGTIEINKKSGNIPRSLESKREAGESFSSTMLFKEKHRSRDSGLADYDTPKSGAPSIFTNSKEGNYSIEKVPASNRSTEMSTGAKSKSPAAARGGNGDSQPLLSPSELQKLQLNDPSFLATITEVQKAAEQVICYSDKWASCSNPETKKSIVNQVCISIWKKFNELIKEFSRRLNSTTKVQAVNLLQERLGALKVCFGDLERVLDYINKSRPHDQSIDYVKKLVVIAQNVKHHLDYCNSILKGDVGDLFDSRTSPRHETTSNIGDTNVARSQLLPTRGPVPPPPRMKFKNVVGRSSDSEDLFAVSCPSSPSFGVGSAQSKTPAVCGLRTSSCDYFSPDYDTPKNSRFEIGSNFNRNFQNTGSVLRDDHRARSADIGRTKRNAAVLGKSAEMFDLLERRNSKSPVAPSKLVTSKPCPGSEQISPKFNDSRVVDYDYPKPLDKSADVTDITIGADDKSRGIDEPINAKDKRTLAFYGGPLTMEFNKLELYGRGVFEKFVDSPEGHRTICGRVEKIIISVRKLVFIGDTLVKNLSSAALSRTLKTKSAELVEATKMATKLAKLILTSLESARLTARQQLAETIEDMVRNAKELRDIVTVQGGGQSLVGKIPAQKFDLT